MKLDEKELAAIDRIKKAFTELHAAVSDAAEHDISTRVEIRLPSTRASDHVLDYDFDLNVAGIRCELKKTVASQYSYNTKPLAPKVAKDKK